MWLCLGGKGLPRAGVFAGTFFFAAPSPLSLLRFKLVVVSISSVWFVVFFFFIFLDAGDAVVATGAVDVVGVAGVADDFGVVLGAGVADTFDVVGTGVFGDSGAAGGWALSYL